MKKNFLTSVAFALVLGLAACGDDGTSNSVTNGEKGEVITLADGSGETVCDDKLDGWVAEAVGKDFRRCQNGEWTKITANEASAEDEIIGGVTVLQSSSSSVIPSEVEGSSSSIASSSSSSSSNQIENPSSSSKANWAYLNPDIDYGEFTDSRDGQVYKTVKICDKENKNCQTWMAENLNYRYVGVKYNYNGYTSDSTSWCYDNDPSKCATYGRLYTWAAAMDSAGIVDPSGAGKGCGYSVYCDAASSATKVRGACPSGWHLPRDAEWSTLYTNVGGTSTAGQKLKANTGLWSSNTGTDEFGISVLPAGDRGGNGDFVNRGSYACFWSSTEDEDISYGPWGQSFYVNDYAYQYYYYKDLGFSVRCLKD
ncbi:MAG: fibrobacter succinogenes major paralogous domain-containing protein [Fibrobacter sp.]|nr:fibrobacter succinogenes major paralogous domain-containing protein [Fibrobacter sp.]